MSLSVQDLLDNPALRTRLLAGKSGLDHTVTWAHSCEVEKPWEWMGSGELLMTTGRNFPSDPAKQVEFLRNLRGAHIVALALAEGMDAPTLTDEAAQEAEESGFPVLETAYEIPFVLLSRAVADATARTSQLTKILRVYDRYRQASLRGASEAELLNELAEEVSAELSIVDLRSCRVCLPSGGTLPEVVQIQVEALAPLDHLPAITRVPTDDGDFLVLPIEDRAFVLLARVTAEAFDLVVLQHVTSIASVLAERSRAAVEARLSVGGRLFTQLLEGRVDSELAKDRLGELDLAPGPWQVLAVYADRPLEPTSVQRELTSQGAAALLVTRPEGVSLLVRTADRETVVAIMEEIGGDTTHVGVSEPIQTVAHVADAAREAHWAREAARIEGKATAYYGEDRPMFLPRTVSEAQAAVARVLGPLLEYDEEHGTDLLSSLQTFFGARRSWQQASKQLMVHKQTLVYRMRRVEELTQRDLDDLDDITELHLALRVRELLKRL
jgi:purine catabolism regulator